ncbi:MAG: universal stress protein [Firmicutes bacterium]|nr:universal stress protein [Bacillota bacterium]
MPLHLVLASDGSTGALSAAQWIRDHCAKDTLIHVVTVTHAPVDVGAPTFTAMPDYAGGLDAAAQETADQRLEPTLRVLDGFSVDSAVLSGRGIGPTLLSYVDTISADAIVVGRRGTSLVEHMVMGSVSQFLAHRAPIPVWIIP